MQTNCRLFYKRFSIEDIDFLNIKQIVSKIEAIDYEPKNQNIALLKQAITDIFSDNGFVLGIALGKSHLTINGLKRKTGLAIQTGNAARFYADLLKLQWLYKEKKIHNAIYVCLSKDSVKDSYSSNLIHAERALREADFFDKIIDLPILFIELDFI
jgi:hypothetical protein